jgi:hypothetical protein
VEPVERVNEQTTVTGSYLCLGKPKTGHYVFLSTKATVNDVLKLGHILRVVAFPNVHFMVDKHDRFDGLDRDGRFRGNGFQSAFRYLGTQPCIVRDTRERYTLRFPINMRV